MLLTGKSPALRIGCLVAAFAVAGTVWLFVFRKNPNLHPLNEEPANRDQSEDTGK